MVFSFVWFGSVGLRDISFKCLNKPRFDMMIIEPLVQWVEHSTFATALLVQIQLLQRFLSSYVIIFNIYFISRKDNLNLFLHEYLMSHIMEYSSMVYTMNIVPCSYIHTLIYQLFRYQKECQLSFFLLKLCAELQLYILNRAL